MHVIGAYYFCHLVNFYKGFICIRGTEEDVGMSYFGGGQQPHLIQYLCSVKEQIQIEQYSLLRSGKDQD